MNDAKIIKQAQNEAYELLIKDAVRVVTEHIEEYYDEYSFSFLDFSDEIHEYVGSKYKEDPDSEIVYDIINPVITNISSTTKEALEKLNEQQRS